MIPIVRIVPVLGVIIIAIIHVSSILSVIGASVDETVIDAVVDDTTIVTDVDSSDDDDDAVTTKSSAFGELQNDLSSSQLKRYGADISWPMHHFYNNSSTTTDTSERQLYHPLYHQYMKGCYDTYNVVQCDANEAVRIERNRQQPRMVSRNFTAVGYAKVEAPIGAYGVLREFWDTHSATHLLPERWDDANIFTNHWVTPTKTLMLDPNPNQLPPDTKNVRNLPRMPVHTRRKVIEQVQVVLEQWTGISLQPIGLYGIRSYANGSILAPHVDR
jgi:hypothetical protein